MNLKTFYKIYYKHRFKKASLTLKIYLFFFYIYKISNKSILYAENSERR